MKGGGGMAAMQAHNDCALKIDTTQSFEREKLKFYVSRCQEREDLHFSAVELATRIRRLRVHSCDCLTEFINLGLKLSCNHSPVA